MSDTQHLHDELRIRAELEREYTWVIAALCARSPDRAVTIYFHDVLMLDGANSAVEKDTTQIDRIVYRLRDRRQHLKDCALCHEPLKPGQLIAREDESVHLGCYDRARAR